mgnify:FL=1|tara:strand:+ start:10 stop:363 length:354 start_codon:yes stop_codon:yes gene_type:complete
MLANGIVNSWAYSIQFRDPMRMLDFYSEDAVLLATYSNLLVGKTEILDYFIDFLNKEGLKCKITDIYTTQMGTSHACSGLYTFSFYDKGQYTEVKARFTYVVKDNQITMHHSSVLPE